jgi:hypothetical protein
VFTSDNYAVDGVSGKVASFADWSDPTHLLVQATSANQAAIPAVHADFAGPCATFAGGIQYASNRVGAVDFMHDGTGGELFLVFTYTASGVGTVLGSRNVSGRGFSIVHFDDRMDTYVLNTANTFLVNAPADASAVLNTPTYLDWSISTAANPDVVVRHKTTTKYSGDATGALEAGNSAQTLRLGSDTSNHASMRWRAAAFFPVLTEPQRAVVAAWIASLGVS